MAILETALSRPVLRWAIQESGLSLDDLAKSLKVDRATVESWLSLEERPNVTQFRRLAAALKRPEAVFFMASPPSLEGPTVQFRHSPGSVRKERNAAERRSVRDAARLQRAARWLLRESEAVAVSRPVARLSEPPAAVAKRARAWLGVTSVEQSEWTSASKALRAWIAALENLGVLVFSYAMGRESCRGFSLWDEYAPVVALNTAYNAEARMFTLFHEYGHILTQTGSICAGWVTSEKADPAERWCEEFAAAVLLPASEFEAAIVTFGGVPDEEEAQLKLVGRLATRYKVSRRATTIRLIELRYAGWDLYKALPPLVDDKPKGGAPPDEPRDRFVLRSERYGQRAQALVAQGLRADLISPTDALNLLDITVDDLSRLPRAAA
ncbi:MAG: XRE family transcriptional regulator [Vicinamibacteria bacterium]